MNDIYGLLVDNCIDNGAEALKDIQRDVNTYKYSKKIGSLPDSDVKESLRNCNSDKVFVVNTAKKNDGLKHTFFRIHSDGHFTMIPKKSIENFKEKHNIHNDLGNYYEDNGLKK